jgi:hypothetical protein
MPGIRVAVLRLAACCVLGSHCLLAQPQFFRQEIRLGQAVLPFVADVNADGVRISLLSADRGSVE